MTDTTWWWLLAGSAVALELFTGTFYLLMVAIGLAAGALAAHLGLALTWQLVTAAVVGSAAVVGWTVVQRNRPKRTARAERSVNLDIGEQVHVDAWQPDGTATVKYRGAQWTAVLRQGESPQTGTYRVTELVGNRLVVEKTPSSN